MARPPRREKTGGPRPIQNRRVPPPDRTDLEAGFWEESRRLRTSLLFSLRGGEKIRGTVVAADEESVWVQAAGGAELSVRKADIRYLEEG